MGKIVTANVQLQCSLGAAPQTIAVTSHAIMKIAGELVATENDKAATVNIPSFGTCKCSSYNPPCMPSPQKWQNTAETECKWK